MRAFIFPCSWLRLSLGLCVRLPILVHRPYSECQKCVGVERSSVPTAFPRSDHCETIKNWAALLGPLCFTQMFSTKLLTIMLNDSFFCLLDCYMQIWGVLG